MLSDFAKSAGHRNLRRAKWRNAPRRQRNGSTAGMINHIRSLHPEKMPESVSVRRADGKRSKVDPLALRGWSTHMVLGQLLSVRAVEAARQVFPQLGGRSMLLKGVEHQVDDIKMEMSSAALAAAESGCKCAKSCDSWKTKCVRQQHYICVLQSGWMPPETGRQRVPTAPRYPRRAMPPSMPNTSTKP